MNIFFWVILATYMISSCGTIATLLSVFVSKGWHSSIVETHWNPSNWLIGVRYPAQIADQLSGQCLPMWGRAKWGGVWQTYFEDGIKCSCSFDWLIRQLLRRTDLPPAAGGLIYSSSVVQSRPRSDNNFPSTLPCSTRPHPSYLSFLPVFLPSTCRTPQLKAEYGAGTGNSSADSLYLPLPLSRISNNSKKDGDEVGVGSDHPPWGGSTSWGWGLSRLWEHGKDVEHPRGEGGVGEQDGGEGDGQGQVGAGRIEDITLSVGTVQWVLLWRNENKIRRRINQLDDVVFSGVWRGLTWWARTTFLRPISEEAAGT